jgi:hypothetical protein
MFSIDQLLAPPPLSAFFSILLIAGFDLIGAFMLHKCGLINGSHKNWIRWQAPIVGAMLLAIFLYPLALVHLTSRLFMQVIASFCITAGTFQMYRAAKKIFAGEKEINAYWEEMWTQTFAKKLLIFMLLGMGLAALGPATNADSLDNHLGVAIDILNKGGVFATPEWFHARLTGNGEVLNAMTMSVGAEQFGSLLQYVSLLGIVGIILFARNIKNDEFDAHTKSSVSDLIALAAFSAPVLLFLVSTSKPQMWPIAMTTFAFALVVHPSRHNLSRQNALVGFGLVCLLVMTASQAKFNYMLGGGVVGMLAISLMAKQQCFWASVGIALIAAALIFAPPVIWKAMAFNASLIDALIHPLPGHLPGTDAMIAGSQFNADTGSNFSFPLSILIPSNIGSFGAMLGVGWLVLIGFRPSRDLWLSSGICAAVIVVIANVILAPPAARMYLEPYFWMLFILVVQANGNSLSRYGWLKWPIYGQAFLTTVACWYAVVLLFPGALSPVWRTHIMERSANGYEVMQWADKVLPQNAVLLTGHRSMALSPRDAVSFEWTFFVDMKAAESQIYIDILKLKKVSHVLVKGPVGYSSPLSNCFGKVLAGPLITRRATRNPFNLSPNYEAWILEFESARLPECAVHANNSRR